MSRGAALSLPREAPGPARVLARRLALALALVTFVALVAYLDRTGYRDASDDDVTLLDCFYYATVSITTTGYGDVTPVSDTARLLTTLLVTPARIVFLILLVGTTVEVLAESSRTLIQSRRWRQGLRNHIIVCGFGTKGRSAADTLIARGVRREQIVVIDSTAGAVAEANRVGFAAIHGDATRFTVLEQAGVGDAAKVVVAADRDDAAVLITLTAREHNPEATIVATVREEENRHLLHQSGADSVIVSAAAAGRMLGLATHTPEVVELLEDLLSVGTGLEITMRPVPPEGVGRPLAEVPATGAPILAVVRQGELLRFDDPRTAKLSASDQLVCLCSNASPAS